MAEGDDMDVEDTDEPGPSTRARVRRPKGGDVKWWSTGIEIDRDGHREIHYGWTDIGGKLYYLFIRTDFVADMVDEYSTALNEKEIFVKTAVWSPSGLSDLGG